MEKGREELRGDADEKAAASAIDVDERQAEDAALDEDGKGLASAEGGCAADLIPGVALGDVRFARFDFFGGDLAGERFEADLKIAMHEDHQRLGVLILHDEGFDDSVLVHTELAGGFGGAAVFDVVVDVLGEGHGVFAEKGGRRSFRDVVATAHAGGPREIS